jgi:hypothetical protein
MRWPLTRVLHSKIQNDTRKSQRRARRPQLESLEGRIVQSILFGSYSNGTFAYNTANHQWREVTPWKTFVMTEGSSGTLYASYDGHGIYKYTYGNNKLVRISDDTASVLSAAGDNTLFAGLVSSRGNMGTAEYTGRWKLINVLTPYQLAAVARDRVYVTYADQGLMADNHGAWVNITSQVPTAISATSDSTLFVSFRDGNGGRIQKLSSSAQWQTLGVGTFDEVSAGNDNTFIADVESQGGNSTVVYANGRFGTISHELAGQIGNDGTTFIYDLGGATWLYAGGNRSVQIKGQEAEAFA